MTVLSGSKMPALVPLAQRVVAYELGKDFRGCSKILLIEWREQSVPLVSYRLRF
jgi:hypothetical protein